MWGWSKSDAEGWNADHGGMDSKVILVVGAVMTAWVMLSLIGNERKKKEMEWEANKPVGKPGGEDEGKGKK